MKAREPVSAPDLAHFNVHERSIGRRTELQIQAFSYVPLKVTYVHFRAIYAVYKHEIFLVFHIRP